MRDTENMANKADDTGNMAGNTAITPAGVTAEAAPQHDKAATKPFQQRWSDEAHTALLGIFVDIMTNGGTVSINAHQEKIVAGMAAHGFAFSWEAMR